MCLMRRPKVETIAAPPPPPPPAPIQAPRLAPSDGSSNQVIQTDGSITRRRRSGLASLRIDRPSTGINIGQ